MDSQRAGLFLQEGFRDGHQAGLTLPIQATIWRYTPFASVYNCQSGVWSQQFDGFEFVELNVTSMNPGVGAVNLGAHKLCSIAGIGGERPHGYVYRTSTIPDASGRYPFQASWNGYSATMDLRVTCID